MCDVTYHPKTMNHKLKPMNTKEMFEVRVPLWSKCKAIISTNNMLN
jgi:hypothetical protein